MFGLIMPAPLAMPVMVMVLPPSCSCVDAALGRVSVVMMPRATLCHSLPVSSAKAAPTTALILAAGSNSPITPVENGNTDLLLTPAACANASQQLCAACMPGMPVPALALPVLIRK